MGKFELGEILISLDVGNFIDENEFDRLIIAGLLNRHQNGDWGDMDEKYKKANNISLKKGQRVVSSFTIGKEIIWIVTESDRSLTGVIFPSQYSEEKNLNLDINS